MDSEDGQLVYTLTQDPPHGRLVVNRGGKEVLLSKSGPVKTFTQTQINNGEHFNVPCCMDNDIRRLEPCQQLV